MLQVNQRPSSTPFQRDEVTGEKPRIYRLQGCEWEAWVCKTLCAIGIGGAPEIAYDGWVQQNLMIFAKRYLRSGGTL